MSNISDELKSLRDELNALKAVNTANNDAFFNVAMALIIFLMQCGFAFLEAGAVRSKNTTNIFLKNVLDSLIAIIGYASVGWALAYGPNPSPSLEPFFGLSEFFLSGTTRLSYFFFQFVFAATASTIITGAVAERCEFVFFLCYSAMITSFIYPILTHWGWTTNGWMAHGVDFGTGQRTTYIDFAGSGMVHVLGGTISLIAAWMMGPRIGRFPSRDNKREKKETLPQNKGFIAVVTVKQITPLQTITKPPKVVDIKGHSVPLASLGGFILMFGFLAFNGGSTAEISSPGVGQTVARAMINTITCGAFAALTYMAVHRVRSGKWTLLLTINACLTGMVSACAGCNQMRPWLSVFVGSVAGLSYMAFAELCVALRVDDPLDAFGVHFGGGIWGLIAACLFTEKGLVFSLFGGSSEAPSIENALLQLAWQMVCALAIIGWSTITTIPPFFVLKKIGWMRVPREIELRGLDIHKHGECSYPLAAYGHGWEEDPNDFNSYSVESFPNDEVNANGMNNGESKRNGNGATNKVGPLHL